MRKIAIIGTTTWGTTLGVMLAERGMEVKLWARREGEARELNRSRENSALLPGIPFPHGLSATNSLGEGLRGAFLVIFAVPSKSLRDNVRRVKEHLDEAMLIMSATKGLEASTAKRMSQVMEEEIPPALHPRICVLSGPNLSREILRGLPATTVVAAREITVAAQVQELMTSPTFRVYTSSDVVGVELGGALKNIIALGAGMNDALGYGDNAKAAFITRGLAEITRLGVAAGADPLTFAGLACLGDLIATCSSPLSRNRYVGQELARGRSLSEIIASMRNVAEGIDTTLAARQMARELGVEMPITEQTCRVLFDGLDPRQAVTELMGRAPKEEWAGIWGERKRNA